MARAPCHAILSRQSLELCREATAEVLHCRTTADPGPRVPSTSAAQRPTRKNIQYPARNIQCPRLGTEGTAAWRHPIVLVLDSMERPCRIDGVREYARAGCGIARASGGTRSGRVSTPVAIPTPTPRKREDRSQQSALGTGLTNDRDDDHDKRFERDQRPVDLRHIGLEPVSLPRRSGYPGAVVPGLSRPKQESNQVRDKVRGPARERDLFQERGSDEDGRPTPPVPYASRFVRAPKYGFHFIKPIYTRSVSRNNEATAIHPALAVVIQSFRFLRPGGQSYPSVA